MQQISEWEKDLSGVIARGKDIMLDYQEYSKCYPFTNERLKDLTALIDKENINNALCVLSSGDHAFNLIYHGISDIDTFDCNIVTDYYALGFKKTAIECLTYQQFLDFFFNSSSEHQEIERYIISCLPEKYQNFWQNYIRYLADSDKKSIGVFGLLGFIENYMQENNNYLSSEQDYKQLQKNLLNAKINFKKMTIKDIYHQKEHYDLIMLSNILQAMKKPLFGNPLNIAEKIYKHNLKENGEMIYLYEFFDSELLGKKERVLERTPKHQNIKYILDGSYAISKKKSV